MLQSRLVPLKVGTKPAAGTIEKRFHLLSVRLFKNIIDGITVKEDGHMHGRIQIMK
jgi:hypothetical protein